MSKCPNVRKYLPYMWLPGKSPFPGSHPFQEVIFPGSHISREVVIPRKSHFPGSHPGKSPFPGSQISWEVTWNKPTNVQMTQCLQNSIHVNVSMTTWAKWNVRTYGHRILQYVDLTAPKVAAGIIMQIKKMMSVIANHYICSTNLYLGWYEEEGLKAMKVEPRMKSIKLTEYLVQWAIGNMDTVN